VKEEFENNRALEMSKCEKTHSFHLAPEHDEADTCRDRAWYIREVVGRPVPLMIALPQAPVYHPLRGVWCGSTETHRISCNAAIAGKLQIQSSTRS
jgi:hypothetical protein